MHLSQLAAASLCVVLALVTSSADATQSQTETVFRWGKSCGYSGSGKLTYDSRMSLNLAWDAENKICEFDVFMPPSAAASPEGESQRRFALAVIEATKASDSELIEKMFLNVQKEFTDVLTPIVLQPDAKWAFGDTVLASMEKQYMNVVQCMTDAALGKTFEDKNFAEGITLSCAVVDWEKTGARYMSIAFQGGQFSERGIEVHIPLA